MTLEQIGQIGDTLSGVAALATLGVVLWTAFKTLPSEMKKFRQQKRVEILAAIAREVWPAVFKFSIAFETLCQAMHSGGGSANSNLSKGKQFLKAWEPRIKQLHDASNELIDAWGLVELYLTDDVDKALKSFWDLRATVIVAINDYADSLDTAGLNNEAYKTLFGRETKEAIERNKKELQTLLRKFAHVGIE